MKISELTRAKLNFAVAKCENLNVYVTKKGMARYIAADSSRHTVPNYVEDWAHAGPIIDNEDFVWIVKWQHGSSHMLSHTIGWEARIGMEDEAHHTVMNGSTKLIAAMRCYVASKLGTDIEIPKELINV